MPMMRLPGGWGEQLAGIGRAVADPLGRLRYGVPTSEKEAFAREAMSSKIGDFSEGQAPSDRAASGYLFERAYPELQKRAQPWIDAARIGWFGDTPEEQSYASYGANLSRLGR